MRFLCVIVLIFFAMCLQSQPEVEFAIKEKPKYILISQSAGFMLEIKNKGSSEAFGVEVSCEEDYAVVDAPRIASLGAGASVPMKVTVSALKLEEGDHAFTLKAVWRNGEGETSSLSEKISFLVRKPSVAIEKIESGMLPGKIRIKTDEKKVISVTIKNREGLRLGNFSLAFFSRYPHFTMKREGIVDVPSEGRKYSYTIEEYFGEEDSASKSFEFGCGLPEGANSASFTLSVMLYWNDYLLDTVELEISVSQAG